MMIFTFDELAKMYKDAKALGERQKEEEESLKRTHELEVKEFKGKYKEWEVSKGREFLSQTQLTHLLRETIDKRGYKGVSESFEPKDSEDGDGIFFDGNIEYRLPKTFRTRNVRYPKAALPKEKTDKGIIIRPVLKVRFFLDEEGNLKKGLRFRTEGKGEYIVYKENGGRYFRKTFVLEKNHYPGKLPDFLDGIEGIYEEVAKGGGEGFFCNWSLFLKKYMNKSDSREIIYKGSGF